MYENQGEEVAAIIKDAAIEGRKDEDDKSDNSAALRKKVQALKRRGTLRKDQIPEVQKLTSINNDDNFSKEV